MTNDSDNLKRSERDLLRAWTEARDRGNLQLSVQLWNQLTDLRSKISQLTTKGTR